MPQPLRRSQFITTYGPGAILEGKQGPRVIPALGLSSLFSNRQVSSFEITDSRLSKALLGDASILRLPSNAELGFALVHRTPPHARRLRRIGHAAVRGGSGNVGAISGCDAQATR